MPLTLFTGPANAAKAGRLLDAVRDAAAQAPLLVVPSAADADRYRRELADGGAVFGVSVLVFADLIAEIAARAGVEARTLGPAARERVAAAAVDRAPLDLLKAASTTDGFPAALARLSDELAAQGVEPGAFRELLRDWSEGNSARRTYSEELAALLLADRELMAEHRLVTGEMLAAEAIAGLQADPAKWGSTPVMLYGFDDLTALELEAIRVLSGPVGVELTMTLTHEPGRALFDVRDRLHAELLGMGAEEIRMSPDGSYYADDARTALSHVERSIFEPDAPRAEHADGVQALCGGGERSELELVAAHVAAAIASGVPPEEIAVVQRGLAQRADQILRVFSELDVPVAIRHEIRVSDSAIGRGVLALLRCGAGAGDASDLLAYLRTPGVVGDGTRVDRFESQLRRRGVTSLRQALTLWGDVGPLQRISAAASMGFADLATAVCAETTAMLAAMWPGQAPELYGEDGTEARVVGEIIGATRGVAALPAPLVPSAQELARIIGGLKVPVGARPGPGRLTVAEPQSLRARRVRQLYMLGLVDGCFPAPARPEPLLGDDERRELNMLGGLSLRMNEDAAAVERVFFYMAASRPTDLLVACWHQATDDGAPAVRSLFVDDLAAVLPQAWQQEVELRQLGEAGFSPELAPTERASVQYNVASAESAEPPVIAPLTGAAALGSIRARHTWSASSIEAWVSCPVKWFVERHLRPDAVDPDPEQMVRGTIAHAVLETIVRQLEERGGLAHSDPEARRNMVAEVLAAEAGKRQLSVNPARLQTELRRLEADLISYLELASGTGSEFRPAHYELSFGDAESGFPPVQVGESGALQFAGQIDRVDLSPDGREAIVYDYKGRAEPPPPARWIDDGRLQVLLYIQAVRELLGVKVVGGFYQPLSSEGRSARGVIEEDSDPRLATKGSDRMPAEELEELLAAAARAAEQAVDEIRAGGLVAKPGSCAWKGGCAYPTICRAGAITG